MPADASHLFVSVGGNDALGSAAVLGEPAYTVGEALICLDGLLSGFRQSYRKMLRDLSVLDKLTTLCTVYDAIPGLAVQDKVALGGFNEVILREAIQLGLPLLEIMFAGYIRNHAGYLGAAEVRRFN